MGNSELGGLRSVLGHTEMPVCSSLRKRVYTASRDDAPREHEASDKGEGTMMRSKAALLLLMVASLAAGAAQGAVFFSVDNVSDRLVLVNTETGAVTPVAPLGMDAGDAELACAGGYLYALHSHLEDVRLMQIDPADGQVLSVVNVTLNGAPLWYAEGLAAINDRLLIAFWNTQEYLSGAVGELALSGEVTFLYDYITFDPMADFDGWTALPNGHLLAIDSRPPSTDDIRLIDVALPPNPDYRVLGSSHPYRALNSLAFSADGELWAPDNLAHNLTRLSMDGSVLETVPYDPSFTLVGLADQECGGPPTPTEVSTWGRVKSVFQTPSAK
jgi:hypothetical protein